MDQHESQITNLTPCKLSSLSSSRGKTCVYLPAELQVMIIENSDIEDLPSLSRVCKFWKNIVSRLLETVDHCYEIRQPDLAPWHKSFPTSTPREPIGIHRALPKFFSRFSLEIMPPDDEPSEREKVSIKWIDAPQHPQAAGFFKDENCFEFPWSRTQPEFAQQNKVYIGLFDSWSCHQVAESTVPRGISINCFQKFIKDMVIHNIESGFEMPWLDIYEPPLEGSLEFTVDTNWDLANMHMRVVKRGTEGKSVSNRSFSMVRVSIRLPRSARRDVKYGDHVRPPSDPSLLADLTW